MNAYCTQFTDRECREEDCCLNDRYIEEDEIMILVKQDIQNES